MYPGKIKFDDSSLDTPDSQGYMAFSGSQQRLIKAVWICILTSLRWVNLSPDSFSRVLAYLTLDLLNPDIPCLCEQCYPDQLISEEAN